MILELFALLGVAATVYVVYLAFRRFYSAWKGDLEYAVAKNVRAWNDTDRETARREIDELRRKLQYAEYQVKMWTQRAGL